jgi:hypothetical protein
MQLDGNGCAFLRLRHRGQMMVSCGKVDVIWLESAASKHVKRASGVDFANQKVDVAHRPESWIVVNQLRESGPLQNEQWHVRLRHGATDVLDDSCPNGPRVRVLCPPCELACPEIAWNRQPCPLDVREHERLHAVVLRGDRELLKRRHRRQSRRKPLGDRR